MPDFDFEGLSTSNAVAWPKRGRVKKPLPPQLVNALNSSFTNRNTASLRLPAENERSFGLLLSKAGNELNFRIERFVEPDPDDSDYIIFHFRVKGRRRQAE